MILMADLRDVPDELANRMMVSHGSAALLRALRGEPELPDDISPVPAVRKAPLKVRPPYVPLSMRVYAPPPSSVARLIESVAKVSGLDVEDLYSKSRWKPHVRARAMAYRLLRDRESRFGGPRYSLPQIGSWFHREHSVVAHALNMFDIYAKDRAYAERYAWLRNTELGR